jgi:hypothetical protein
MGMGGWALGPPSLPRWGVGAAPGCIAPRRACLCSRYCGIGAELVLPNTGSEITSKLV